MPDSCRICLKAEGNLVKTSSAVNNRTYNEELCFCVPEIDWACSDESSQICPNCIKNLEVAVNFRRLCLESHKAQKKLHKFANEESNGRLASATKLEVNESTDDIHSDVESEMFVKGEDEPVEEVISQNKNGKRVSRCKQSRKESVLMKNNAVKGKNQAGNENINGMKLYVPSKKDRVCIFCNCKFSKYATLTNHVRSVHTLDKCFKCDLCDEGFTNAEILSRHKNRHTGDRKYVCSYCGKKFFTNSDLNHHVQRHQNKRNYKCHICENKSFNTANSLRTHKLVVHTNPNEWKYLCTICGRKCVTQASLNVHMKRHSNEKDFACHLCPKKFCTKAEVSKHVLSHSNMRLHKCEICSQEYKDRKVMERHMTKKHGIGNAKIVERVKKYFCDACPKKFVGKRQLEKHQRSHSGERPFRCEICEQAFICSSYIKGHMRSKHLIDAQDD